MPIFVLVHMCLSKPTVNLFLFFVFFNDEWDIYVWIVACLLYQSNLLELLIDCIFSNIDCHLRSLQQSVEHSLVVRDLNQAMQLQLKIVEHHQHQPNSHSSVLQHVMISTIFHPNSMFSPNPCDFVNNISDDNWINSNEKKGKHKFISILKNQWIWCIKNKIQFSNTLTLRPCRQCQPEWFVLLLVWWYVEFSRILNCHWRCVSVCHFYRK